VRVEQRDREALVAARVFERVEPDDPDPLECLPKLGFLDGRPCRQPLDIASEPVDLFKVRAEDRLEAPAVVATGHRFDPPRQPPLSKDEHEHGEHEDDDEPRERKNGRAERLVEGSLDVDR
jgi:hypothetical protein